MTYKTKKEAAQRMINTEMNAIPLSLIEKAYPHIDGFDNITPIKAGEYVIYDGEEYEVELNDGEHIYFSCLEEWYVEAWEVEKEEPVLFPMWGTVWQTTGLLSDWVGDNLQTVANCGFEIYEAEDIDGYILGINGAGYDFYEKHWIPLYEAQGLKWHDEEVERHA